MSKPIMLDGVTREDAQRLLPILTAVAKGKPVQFRKGGGKWTNPSAKVLNLTAYNYEWRVVESDECRRVLADARELLTRLEEMVGVKEERVF